MARISQYGQDGTLNKLDKVVGTDSATGATKNYTIDSMIGLVNSEDLINVFDGVSYAFKSYEEGSTTPKGIINLNAGAASNAAFSAVNQIYISILDKHGNSIANYLDDTLNSFIRIVQKTNIDTYGVLEVTAVTDHDGGAYKLLTVTPRVNNGNIIVNEEYFVSNYSAVFDQDFSDDSVTEFGDVTDAGSGEIITDAERTSLNNFTANGLVHADVVDNVTSTTTNVPLSANQGKVLKDLIDSLTALLDVDEADKPALDTLREVVNFCQINEATLSSLGISNIAGLQAALDSKQNTEVGKGLSTEDFTTALLTKLNGIAAGAQGNVKSNWNEANTGSDAFIQNKPSDLTNLTLYSVTRLNDVTSAGSGDIITSAERTKLTGIAAGAEVNVQADWNEASSSADSFIQNKPSLAPSNAEQNVQSDFNETDTNSDAFILNKPDLTTKADKATTIEVAGTANEIEITPSGAQDLSTNRTFTVGLPNDVTIGEDLKVNETIELVNSQSTTPTFDNGIYYSTENGHDTLHFRYHGHDLSIDYLTENIPTGILNGGVLSTNTSTTFDVAAGDGVINILNKDNSDPHPEIKKVAWSATTVTHTLGNAGNANQLNTWIYVDSSGNIQQTLTTPSPALWRNNIVLGSVIHSSNVIRFVKTFPRPSYSNGNTFAEFVEIFGPLKKSGHLLTVNSTNTLALDRAAGISFGVGRNYQIDAEEPNLVSDGASTPAFHRYSSTATGFTKDDGTAGAGYTSIDPTKYDNSGTLTTASSGQYTAQRLFHFPNNTNVIVAYYGKAEYASIDEAEKNYLLEDFQEADNTSSQAIYLGALIVKGNATDLGNSSQAKILTGGIFRSLSATNLGGVAADAAINDLTDVNITGVANNEVLKYNGSTGNWENQTDDTIGGSGSGAANKIAIWSGASTLTQDTNLHWDTTNDRLGIGTSSPAYKLDISGSLRATSESTFRSNLLFPDNARIKFGDNEDFNLYRSSTASYISSFDGDILIDNHADDKDIILRGDDGSGGLTEYLRLDGSTTNAYFLNPGNVGIGTSSPSRPLTVNGDNGTGMIINDATNDKALRFRATGNTFFIESTNNAESSYSNISLEGNVGIGIGNSTPNAALEVHNTLNVGDGTSVTSIGLQRNSANYITATDAAGYLVFRTGGSNERLRITPTGNVGIGTTSPAEKLEVDGNVILDADNANLKLKSGVAGTKGDIQWTFNSDSTVYASVGIEYDNRGTDGFLIDSGYPITIDAAGAYTRFSRNGAEHMRIDSSGQVGIGLTNATAKLHVVDTSNSGTNDQIVSGLNSGSPRFKAHIVNYNGVMSLYDSGTNEDVRITSKGGEDSWINNGGNVGIGTTSPNTTLHIADPSSSSTTFRISAQSNVANFAFIRHTDNTANTSRLDFGTTYGYSTEVNAMSIFNGNVGIGTTTPTQKLEVDGVIESPYLEYKPIVFYDFNSDTTSDWTLYNATLSTPDNSIVRWTSTGSDPNLSRTFNFDGGQNQIIKIRYKVISGTPSSGQIFYAISGGHSYSSSYSKSFTLVNDSEWHTLVLDMSNLNAGGTDWIDNTITNIRFDLTDATGIVVDLDWISIGGNGNGTQYFENTTVFDGPVEIRGGSFASGIDAKSDAGIVLKQGEAIYSENTGSYLRNIIQHSSGGDIEIGQGGTAIIGNITIKPGTSGDIKFYPSGSQDVTFNSSGNVGIGTSSPASLLHTYSSGNNTAIIEGGSSNIVSLEVKDGTNKLALTKYTNSHNEIRSTGNVPLLFKTNGNNERMRITSNGNVGIGTTSPNQKFHIYGNSNYSNLFTVTDNSVGINTQYPSRNGGLHIADSGIKISNSYGNMDFGLLYNHIDLRVPSSTSKFYVSNGSSGPGGPGDTQLAPILVGQIGVKETSPTVAIDAGNATDAIKVPVGTTGERPTGAAGMFRYNSTDGQFEGYTTEWGAIAGGGSGGGGEIVKQTFSGTGSQATFTLANTIADIDNISVYVSGVYQYPSNYTVNGADVTFNTGSIPASGTNNVHVIHTTAVAILTAAVTSVNGQTGAVTFNTYTAPTVYVINTSTTAVANSVYVLTANLTLTLPASPSSGDSIKISNRSGVATCVLARNGSNIMGSASDLTLDTASASFELIYSDATNGWVIIGQ